METFGDQVSGAGEACVGMGGLCGDGRMTRREILKVVKLGKLEWMH